MNKNVIGFYLTIMGFIALVIIATILLRGKKDEEKTLTAKVLNLSEKYLTVMADDNNIYNLLYSEENIKAGDLLIIKYTGLLDNLNSYQTIEVIDFTKTNEENNTLLSYDETGIFSRFYKLAESKLNTLSLDEKIGQLLLARYPNNNAISDMEKYNLSGFIKHSYLVFKALSHTYQYQLK